MNKFYVSCVWHNWPEGGSYGTTVVAETHEEAERLCKLEMAESLSVDYDYEGEPAFCTNCLNTDQDGSDICPDCGNDEWDPGVTPAEQVYADYASQWHLIGCYKIKDSTGGQILQAFLNGDPTAAERAWEYLNARDASVVEELPVHDR